MPKVGSCRGCVGVEGSAGSGWSEGSGGWLTEGVGQWLGMGQGAIGGPGGVNG